MTGKRWTWDEAAHAVVADVLASPSTACNLDDWCDRLETAPRDAVVGKLLCVCAAAAIARAVVAAWDDTSQSINALDLLDRWIDDPTDEAFDQITTLIFDEGTADGLHTTSRWALRTATSSPGNYEAGWALAATCSAALEAGVGLEDLRAIAARAVLSRRSCPNPGAPSSPDDA
jgi:hypothetical protein